MGRHGSWMATLTRIATITVLALGLFAGFAAGTLYGGLAHPVLPGSSGSAELYSLELNWSPPSPLLDDGRDRELLGDMLAGSELASRVIGSSQGQADFRFQGRSINSVRVGLYSGDFFRLLGVSSARGRLPPAPNFGEPSGPKREIVIGHALWESLGAPEIGSTIEAVSFSRDAREVPLLRIVGVAPPGFSGPQLRSSQQVWLAWNDWPGVIHSMDYSPAKASAQTLDFVAVDGMGGARTALQARLNELARLKGIWQRRDGVMSLEGAVAVDVRARRELLAAADALRIAATLLMVLVACAFCLDRWMILSRQRAELSVRRGLGESPLRSMKRVALRAVRDLGLAVVAASVMVAICYINYSSLAQMLFRVPVNLVPPLSVDYSLIVVGVVYLLALIVVPLLLSPELRKWEITSRGGAVVRERRVRLVAVGAGVLLAVLAVGLGLGGSRQVDHWTNVGLGFSLDGARVFHYHTDDDGASMDRLVSRKPSSVEVDAMKHALGGVVEPDDIVFASSSPLSVMQVVQVVPPGQTSEDASPAVGWMNDVSENYFRRLRIMLLEGSGFDLDATDEIIINSTLAKQYFAGNAPIGSKLELMGVNIEGMTKSYRIAGVVADAHYLDPRGQAVPMIYRPLRLESGLRTVMVFDRSGQGLLERLNAALQQVEPRWYLRDYGDARALTGMMMRETRVRNMVLWAVVLAVLPLAALVLLNTGGHVLVEHHREVAIMRALGAKRTRAVKDLLHKRLGKGLLISSLCSLLLVPVAINQMWPELRVTELVAISLTSFAVLIVFSVVLGVALVQQVDDAKLVEHLKAEG